MASSKLFETILKKIVKPSSPTPPSLRNYKLSFIDQLLSKRYMPVALFFPNQKKHQDNTNETTSQISSLLQTSLSKTLSFYYPYAGTLRDNISIDCNDTGATFIEARIKCSMSKFLKQTNDTNDVQHMVFPSGLPWSFGHDQHSLVVAQLNHFDCGGKAVSLCMTHKIGDGHTLCNFMNDWAAMSRQSTEIPSPQFIGESILPPSDNLPTDSVLDYKQGKDSITGRYTFDSHKLAQLKSKASTETGVQNPSRFEVVSALLHTCAMSASMACSGSFKPSIFASVINIRPLMVPPVTQRYAGNLFFPLSVLTTHEREINYSRLVSEIRKAKTQNYEKFKGMTTTARLISATFEMLEQAKVLQGEIDEYGFTSICGYPTYNIDFGWGRPSKVTTGPLPFEKHFLLMDNGNLDGIDVLVSLPESIMSAFQSNPELLTFASLDASY